MRKFNNKNFDKTLILDKVSCKGCVHSKICVLVCKPLTQKLKPFPTSFWLACPYLMRIAGELESQGGVRELEAWLAAHNKFKEWREFNLLHQQIRLSLLNFKFNKINLSILNGKNFLSRCKPEIYKSLRRGGVGGINYLDLNNKIYAKCLHLQLASFIALNYHPGAEWLREKLGNRCPAVSYK